MGRRGAPKVGLTLGIALSLIAAAPARAAELGYGGRVVDETGAPLAGPVDVALRFFDAPKGGSQLGSALSFKAVALVDGNFQLTLGLSDAQQSEIFGDGSHTVYVEVEAATKVYPRQKFLAVPVALRVPVDNATLEFASDSKLTIKQVSMSQVVGLSDALAANSSTTAASASESGYLSAADWTRFDAKQAAIDESMTVNAGGLTTAQQSALLVKPYGTAANETGELRFEERTGGNYVALRAPDVVAADLVYTLPGADGAPGQFLSTNGSGMLAWTSPAGGGDMIAAANLSDLTDRAAARSNLSLGALATASAVGSAQITDGTIANADIAGTAAIATSKLSGAVTSISGHGLGALATMSTVGSGEIANGAIADADVSGTAAIATSKLSGALTSISGHGLGSLASASAVGSAEITDGAVSSTDIADGTIANADISASAAIATAKLSGALTSISGHGLGSLAAMSSVSAAEITDGTIANADISGTAAVATSKLSGPLTAVSGHGLGALATLSAVGSAQITDASIADADISGTAAIATSKLSGALTAVSGHGLGALATLNAVSTTEITDGTIANADISGTAAIDASKIAGGSVSSAEFQYLDGLTSGVQTQLDAKASAASPTFTGAISSALGSAAAPSYSFSGDSNTGVWSSGSDTVNVSTAGSERLTVSSTGNVGIGTTGPTSKFVVAADGAGTWGTEQIRIQGATNTNDRFALGFNTSGADSTHFAWMQGGNPSTYSNLSLNPVGGNVGIGTTSPSAKLNVAGQIVSNQTVVASGATVDFGTGNVQILESVGGTAITLNNMVDGGAYTLIISDGTARTYTFTNCTNTHFTPANAATTASKRTIYSILKTTESTATHCYISWVSGL